MKTKSRAPSLWYRARYWLHCRVAALLGLTQPTDVEQALRNCLWVGQRIGRDHYLGHCPYHPEEPLQDMRRGRFQCVLCQPVEFEPPTDPRRHMRYTTRPLQQWLQEHRQDVGPYTQEHRATTWPKTREGAKQSG